MIDHKSQTILFLRHGFAGKTLQTSSAFLIDDDHVAVNRDKHVSVIGETLNKLVIAYVNHEHLGQGDNAITRVIRSNTDRTAETAQHMFPNLDANIDQRTQPLYPSALDLHTYGIHQLVEEIRNDGRNTAIITHDFVPYLAAYLTTEEGKNWATSIKEKHDSSTYVKELYEDVFLKGNAGDLDLCDRDNELQFRRHCESSFNLREARNSGGILLHYDGEEVTVTHIHPPTIVKHLLEEATSHLPTDPPSPALAPLKRLIENTDHHGFENLSPEELNLDDYRVIKIVAERFSKPENAPQEGLLSDPEIRKYFCDFLSQAAEMGTASLRARDREVE